MNYSLKKRDLRRFLDKLIRSYEVIAPVKRDIHRYEPIKSGAEVNLNFINSIYPLKKWFLPPEEELFSFKGGKITARFDNQKRIIFGMRPCDVNALLRMVCFFSQEFPDPYFKKRVRNNIIIALSCQEAGENCFCTSLGTYKLEGGYDLLFTETAGSYIVQVGSDRGKKLIDKMLFTETSREPEIKLKCRKKLDRKDILKLKTSFYHEIWAQEAENCLSCSACTMTCPTCSCFRVLDVPNMDTSSGSRKREWTSCQLKNFTVVAGGYSFREKRSMRLKNRVYHQLDYFKDLYGKYLCVGCGRCITNCPTNIDMTKIIKRL